MGTLREIPETWDIITGRPIYVFVVNCMEQTESMRVMNTALKIA